eukprot:3496232-Amphidinium_carterae.1
MDGGRGRHRLLHPLADQHIGLFLSVASLQAPCLQLAVDGGKKPEVAHQLCININWTQDMYASAGMHLPEEHVEEKLSVGFCMSLLKNN